jgi:hypothetical protein
MTQQSRNKKTYATQMRCPQCGFQCKNKFLGAISRNYARIADELSVPSEKTQNTQISQRRCIALVSYFTALEMFVSAWLRESLDTKKIGKSIECYMEIHWKIHERLTKGFKDVTGRKLSSESPGLTDKLEKVRERRNGIVHGGKFPVGTIKEDLEEARGLFFDTVKLLSTTKSLTIHDSQPEA